MKLRSSRPGKPWPSHCSALLLDTALVPGFNFIPSHPILTRRRTCCAFTDKSSMQLRLRIGGSGSVPCCCTNTFSRLCAIHPSPAAPATSLHHSRRRHHPHHHSTPSFPTRHRLTVAVPSKQSPRHRSFATMASATSFHDFKVPDSEFVRLHAYLGISPATHHRQSR